MKVIDLPLSSFAGPGYLFLPLSVVRIHAYIPI